MLIEPGQQLLHYRIVEKLGAGGMGEVWKAVDMTLDRTVAIKILPETFSSAPDRLARFEREAKALAALNHPNIAAVYGFHEKDGQRFLSMEYVEGQDLATRLMRGPLPIDEAVAIATGVAAALGAAHARGIVHRDLKPANVMLDSDGEPKVLDFGLAKAMAPSHPDSEASADHALSPTVTSLGTVAGVILGTAAYMAPEQARGKPVDRRADIWSFGVMLYEMLTGKAAFRGETVSDTLASVLKSDLDMDLLPADTPAAVRRVLKRCLERNLKDRLHDADDARIELQHAFDEVEARGGGVATTPWTPARVMALGGLALVAGLAIGALFLGGGSVETASPQATRFSIALTPDHPPFYVASYPGHGLAISRDGSMIAYDTSPNVSGSSVSLSLRRLNDLSVEQVSGTEAGSAQPFFSPDGAWVASFSDVGLQKVPSSGGPAITLVRDTQSWFRGSWSDDRHIVYDTWNSGLRVIDPEGGAPRVLTQPTEEWHLAPQMLPGSDTFLYFVQTATQFSIESMTLDGESRKVVLEDGSCPVYLASGHLLFMRDGNLMVAPFDADATKVTGAALPVDLDVMVDEVNTAAPVPQLAVSLNGTLVYAPRGKTRPDESRLVWVDRAGNVEPFTTVPFSRPHFSLSHDGSQLAFVGRAGADVKYMTMDMSRRTLTPFRTETLDYPATPLWSVDGSQVYFPRFGTHRSELFSQPTNGGEPEKLATLEGTWLTPTGVTPDGRYVVLFIYHPDTASDIWYYDRDADDPAKTATPFLADPGNQGTPSLSPDGHWLAYSDYEMGDSEIYLRRFPEGDSVVRVSVNGGYGPLWSPDGSELFYRQKNGHRIIAVSVDRDGGSLKLGDPRVMFEGSFQANADVGYSWAMHPDGDRFLMVVEDALPKQADELIVVLNWFSEIEAMFEGRN